MLANPERILALGQLQSTNGQLSTQLSKAAQQEEELVKAKETIKKCEAQVEELKRKTRELEDRNGMTSATLKALDSVTHNIEIHITLHKFRPDNAFNSRSTKSVSARSFLRAFDIVPFYYVTN